MKDYQVLWIEDQPEAQPGFMDQAELQGIYLHNYRTSREGISELEQNLQKYDAVILDAKVYDESENEVPSTIGLRNARDRIIELSSTIMKSCFSEPFPSFARYI